MDNGSSMLSHCTCVRSVPWQGAQHSQLLRTLQTKSTLKKLEGCWQEDWPLRPQVRRLHWTEQSGGAALPSWEAASHHLWGQGWSLLRARSTLVDWMCSGKESMKRSPMGSQVSRTLSAWSSVVLSSSMAPLISSSCSSVRSMWRCWSTHRAVSFSHSSLATFACFQTKRLMFWIRWRGETSVKAKQKGNREQK